MVKIVEDKNDIDELFKTYFNCIRGRYFTEALKAFESSDGYGYEYVCCSLASTYQSWEEGYFGKTGVKISIDFPAASTDTMAIITNGEFFDYLMEASKNFITEFPEKQNEVESCLENIKNKLNIE